MAGGGGEYWLPALSRGRVKHRLSIESANGAVAARRASDLEEKYNELSCSQFKMLLYRCVDSKLHTDWFHGMRPVAFHCSLQ